MAKLSTIEGPILMQIKIPLLCANQFGSHVRMTTNQISNLQNQFQANFRKHNTTGLIPNWLASLTQIKYVPSDELEDLNQERQSLCGFMSLKPDELLCRPNTEQYCDIFLRINISADQPF